jgi:hypothetical protein
LEALLDRSAAAAVGVLTRDVGREGHRHRGVVDPSVIRQSHRSRPSPVMNGNGPV